MRLGVYLRPSGLTGAGRWTLAAGHGGRGHLQRGDSAKRAVAGDRQRGLQEYPVGHGGLSACTWWRVVMGS